MEIDEGGVTAQSSHYPYQGKHVHRSYTAENNVGQDMYTYEFDLYFEYNGAGDVRRVQSDCSGTTHTWLWYYKSCDTTDRDFGGSFESSAEYHFEQCVTKYGCVYDHTRHIEATGNYTGSVRTTHN